MITDLMDFLKKIVPLSELKEKIQLIKSRNQTIALCHGTFDLLHPGHLRHFQEAKGLASFLAVTVTPDRFVIKGEGRPVFGEELRMESIASLEYVDYVALNNAPDAIELLQFLAPSIYVKGSDYKDPKDDPTGKITAEVEAIRSVGGSVHYTQGIRYSSTQLLRML